MDRNPEAIMEEGKEEMLVKKIVNESFVREMALECKIVRRWPYDV
jgi:hypothetical protein